MTHDDIIRMARESGWMHDHDSETGFVAEAAVKFADLVASAERKVIMDSLQKQAELATDALDRRWALEMIAAVAARSSK